VGIVNDDWTHLDGTYESQEEADQVYASVQGSLELYGWLTPIGESDDSGYFDCPICADIQCGNGHIMECED
jgi:hypothetical protein